MKKISLLFYCCTISIVVSAQVTLLHTFETSTNPMCTMNYPDDNDVAFVDYTLYNASCSGAYYTNRKYYSDTKSYVIEEYDKNFNVVYSKSISVPQISNSKVYSVQASKYTFNDDENWEILVTYFNQKTYAQENLILYTESGNVIYDFGPNTSTLSILNCSMQNFGSSDFRICMMGMKGSQTTYSIYRVNKQTAQNLQAIKSSDIQITPRKVIENGRTVIYVNDQRFDITGVEL